MARNDPQINIRLPAALKQWIETTAAANNRSMNAEIVHRLEASMKSDMDVIDMYRQTPPTEEAAADSDPLQEYLGSREMVEVFEEKMRLIIAEAMAMASENKKNRR